MSRHFFLGLALGGLWCVVVPQLVLQLVALDGRIDALEARLVPDGGGE